MLTALERPSDSPPPTRSVTPLRFPATPAAAPQAEGARDSAVFPAAPAADGAGTERPQLEQAGRACTMAAHEIATPLAAIQATIHRPRVLIVDDEEDVVFVLHRVLYQDNDHYDVLLARSAEVAHEILAEVPIDVIVTDVHLPERSGMELLSWASLACPHTRVIVMTAFDVNGIKGRAHAFGCLRLMRKPFDPFEMRATVLAALDRRGSLAGALSELSPVDVIQMLCLAHKTTAVRFFEDGSAGAVYLEAGEPVHAVWDDLSGEDAFYRIMAVRSGVFQTVPFPLDLERTITNNWQYLLIEGTRRLDEAVRDHEPWADPARPMVRPAQASLPPRAVLWSSAARGRASPPPPLNEPRTDVSLLIDEGFAELRAGRRDGARAAWEQALRLDPKNRLVELNLRKLNGALASGVTRR